MYHFSSESHRAKFIKNLRAKELWLNDSLSRRFKATVYLPILADIQLYTQVETRGFYITGHSVEYSHPYEIFVDCNMAQIGAYDA